MMNSDLILGYDFDKWYGYGIKEPVITDISTKTNNISKVVSKISRPTKGRLLCYSIFGGNFG